MHHNSSALTKLSFATLRNEYWLENLQWKRSPVRPKLSKTQWHGWKKAKLGKVTLEKRRDDILAEIEQSAKTIEEAEKAHSEAVQLQKTVTQDLVNTKEATPQVVIVPDEIDVTKVLVLEAKINEWGVTRETLGNIAARVICFVVP